MITVEKIRIYDRYGGDGDGFARVGRNREKELFEGNEWIIIDNLCQDIQLINNRLAAQAYATQTIKKLKEQCNQDGFIMLANRIPLYKDFQQVVNILQRIRSYATWNSDVVWTRYDNAAHFLSELDQDITGIEHCDFLSLEKVCIHFAPTGTYQELAISNGWGNGYLQLAEEFDQLYKRITQGETAHDTFLPEVKKTWWQRLFGIK